MDRSNNQQRAVRYSLKRRAAWNKGAAPGWALFKAAQRADSRTPIGAARPKGTYGSFSQLAFDKRAQARFYQMQGYSEQAANSVIDIIELGIDISRGAALRDRSLASRVMRIGADTVVLEPRIVEDLTASQARAATARLETLLRARPTWLECADNQNAKELLDLKADFDAGNWRDKQERYVVSDETDFSPLQRRFTSKRAVRHDREIIDADLRARIKAGYTLQPLPQLKGISAFSYKSWDYKNIQLIKAREQMRLDMLLLRLALRAYVQERGAYPATLNQLQNDFLKRISTDEFNRNRPYHYASQGSSYRLWSIGPDAVDHGGTPIMPGDSLPNSLPRIVPDEKGDIVVTAHL